MPNTEIEEKPPSNSRLIKRLSGIVTVGAIPGAIVGFIGDVFTPLNGWVLVLLLGVTALLLATLSGPLPHLQQALGKTLVVSPDGE